MRGSNANLVDRLSRVEIIIEEEQERVEDVELSIKKLERDLRDEMEEEVSELRNDVKTTIDVVTSDSSEKVKPMEELFLVKFVKMKAKFERALDALTIKVKKVKED